MASESTSKPEQLIVSSGSTGCNENDSRMGSSVWNLCPLPSDSQTVDLRDITPSISPVFTDDQVRELSGQAGDLDVLGDNFLPHDTFKRIAEVLSPEQTNLLISTCSSLCPESDVLSYTDPVLGALSHFSSPLKHGNDPMLNPQVLISEGMNPLLGNRNEKGKSNASRQMFISTSTTVVSSSTGIVTTASAKQSENDGETKTKEANDNDNENTLNENDTGVKDNKEKKESENVRSTYSLRSSPRKPVKGQGSDDSPVRKTRQRAKKESPSEADRRKSPRGLQKQEPLEKGDSTQSGKGEKRGRGGRQKNEIPTLDPSNSKDECGKQDEEGMSLRRSSRIQRKDTSPAKPGLQSPRKGRGGRKKTTPEEPAPTEPALEEEKKDSVEEKPEIKEDETSEKPPDLQVGKLSEGEGELKAKECVLQVVKLSVEEEELKPKESVLQVGKLSEEEDKLKLKESVLQVGKLSEEEEVLKPKDSVLQVGKLSDKKEVKTEESVYEDDEVPKEEKESHIKEEHTELIYPSNKGLKPMNDEVKQILTEILNLDKEICDSSKDSVSSYSKPVEEENEVSKDVETPIEETKDSSEEGKETMLKKMAEKKKVCKKDLQPSRRSNRISESIQKREIEVAVKKAQEEMLKEIEEEERKEREEREEEERKKREEEDSKKKEEEEQQRVENERIMKEEKERMEKELMEKGKEQEEDKKVTDIKKEKDKPKKEIKSAAGEHHKKKEKPADHKTKEATEKGHTKSTEDKSLKSPSPKKKQHVDEEGSEEKKESTSLFAVGIDHEIISKVKHKRQLSEDEKPTKVKKSRTSENSKEGRLTEEHSSDASSKAKNSKEHSKNEGLTSDEESIRSEEELMEDDSDYDPEYDPERLWCICRKPHGNRFMICCDSCEEWLHGDCVSITKDIGKEMEKNGIEYICPRCVIAKKKLKAQFGDAAEEPSKLPGNVSGTPNRPRRHRRLKIPLEPGEKRRHHRHSADHTSKTGRGESQGHEKRSKNAGHKDSPDVKRRNSDPSSYKIPKKVRTTPTPASFASKAQRQCINCGCQNHAEHNSVYCSDTCISKHAEESISLLHEERRKRIGPKPTTLPTSSINVPMPWESPHSTVPPTSPLVKERVAVIERTTGRLIAGVAAPAEQDLVHWLKRHPTFQVIRPSVSKEVKKKDKREEEKAIRDNVKRSLREILSGRLKEVPELKLSIENINKLSFNIEEELHKLFGDAGPRYKSKYRSLAFNLKDFRNKVLFHHVLSGEVPTDKLVSMTAEQLANRELARWRERESKHTLEMIKLNQEDINPTKGHIKKTHKGEVELDEDEDLSTLEVHAVDKQAKEKSEVTEADSNTSPGPLLVDTTDQHRIHLFDLNCRICTGKMQPPGEPPRQEEMLMLVSTTTPIQALAESSVPSPPPITMDSASVSSTEAYNLGSVSPPPTIKPVRRDKPVWKGFIMMQSVAKFGTNAFRVSGPCDDLLQLLPDTLHLQGRIGFQQVWDYVYQLRNSTTRDVSVIRYEASSDEEKTSYVSLYSYFYSRKRCGVVHNCYTGVKDMYLMPLASHSPIPIEMLPFDGPGLEEPRPHMLLGVIVRTKAHFKRPRPIHHKPSSPQAKRRHINIAKSSEDSLPKDSPPPDVDDIVFQFAHNRKTSSDSKPALSPSSGSSEHSSILSSPSLVTASLSGSTDASLDSATQKTQREDLQDLEARAKQYISSALQSASKTAEKGSTTTEESKPSDDDDKPYDPEEDFDLDLELEKPIDAKKENSETTAGSTADASEVSTTAGLSSTSKVTSDAPKPVHLSVQNMLPNSLSTLTNISLITPVASATPTVAASLAPSLPPSIFMPITTNSTSSGSLLTSTTKPLGTQPLSLPTADLAGIVKLIGATLKQTNVPGQAPTGDAQKNQTSTVQGAATTTTGDPKHDYPGESSGPHKDPQYRGSVSEGRPETSYGSSSSIPEGSRRPSGPHHDEGPAHRDRSTPAGNLPVLDRQRIDRERLEWRERRSSRDGPRDQTGPRDLGPHDDRWRDQRDPRGPPVRRPSDDRYHNHPEAYGSHRGDHQDRGRYNPHHRDDRRDRREDRRNDPRNSDRWREKWRR